MAASYHATTADSPDPPANHIIWRPRLMEAEQLLELQLEADQRLELLLGDADAQDPETMADWLIWKAL